MLYCFSFTNCKTIFSHKMKFYFFPSCPPAPRYRQELPQIIGIIPILKITTKFTVSPSCLIRVVSWKLLGGCFVFPRLGFITKGLSVQTDLCIFEAQLIWLLHCVTITYFCINILQSLKCLPYCFPYYHCSFFISNDLIFFRSYAQICTCERKSYFWDTRKSYKGPWCFQACPTVVWDHHKPTIRVEEFF